MNSCQPANFPPQPPTTNTPQTMYLIMPPARRINRRRPSARRARALTRAVQVAALLAAAYALAYLITSAVMV